jgi:cyclic beta-1,2-glucan synthetase
MAWDTWRYFEELMNEQRNHLIPDNIQLVPARIVAERTSPTNLGLAIMATVSAYDLGFLPLSSVIRRMSASYEALSKLERYRGHFLNWYQIVTLQPLYPRYVSTVDSGNFIANMMATHQALAGFNYMPLVGDEHWPHLSALCLSLSQVVRDSDDSLASDYASLGKALAERPAGLAELDRICGTLCGLVERSKSVLALLSGREEEDALRHSMLYELSEFSKIAELFAWNGPLKGFGALLREHSSDARLNGREELEKKLAGVFKIAEGRPLSMSILSKMQRRISALLRRFGDLNQELLAGLSPEKARSVSDLEGALAASGAAIETLLAQVSSMKAQCNTYVKEADFEFLFDFGKSLFVIGYNVDEARRDPSYYDLLASECRITSLIAIAHGQVPQKHWFVLGRALADSAGGKALLSWSGTMFEYLMPMIMTRNYQGTILSETYEAVIRAQRAYGRKRGRSLGRLGVRLQRSGL